MVLGGDVTHPMGDMGDVNSICALVGSMDRYGGKFCTEVELNPPKVDIIENLEAMAFNLFKQYHKHNDELPDILVYYRDGVSDGQFQEVMSKEYAAMVNAIKRVNAKISGSSWKPKITICIVQKRHHLRMFQADRKYQDKSNNACPGTVIDSGVTHPKAFDFYLMSHAGIQGTSRPSHYHVLCDLAGFTASEFEQLTYDLCHVYQRCTRSVSIPTPVYYAHLAAFRARALSNRFLALQGTRQPSMIDRSTDVRLVKSKSNDEIAADRAPTAACGMDTSDDVAVQTFQGIHKTLRNTMFFC
jgi:eukaryotic translation initiation factor 2C